MFDELKEKATEALSRYVKAGELNLTPLEELAKAISVRISEALGPIPRVVSPIYAYVLSLYEKSIEEEFNCSLAVDLLGTVFEASSFADDEVDARISAIKQKTKVDE